MRRNGLLALLFVLVLSIGGIVYTVAADNEPLLGLDLQGGVSVVLEPTETPADGTLSQAIEIMRQRVDGLGVAEPEISRQGDAIVVQLPGVDDRERALELVGQTAELRFRPVLFSQPLGLTPEELQQAQEEAEASTTTTTAPDDADENADDADADAGSDESTTTTAAPDDADTDDADADADADGSGEEIDLQELLGLTPADEDDPSQPVTLAQFGDDGVIDAVYSLGPVLGAEGDDPATDAVEEDDPATPQLTGEALEGATAELNQATGAWTVSINARGGESGIELFNQQAFQCFNAAAECPTRQLAMALDGRVVSAPSINAANFDADSIQISGSDTNPFTESEAKDLALVIRYGSLPVELEAQEVRSVSATIGQDALDAGVAAGLIGLALVAIYMIAYYRLLGLVAMASLAVSAAMLWTIVAYIGETQGLALTLAGVTGIIVSIGVAVDSNVVFYEHLKEDVSRGRSLRTAVDGSFSSAFSTIVKADVASLIGAGTLYVLTVGPVRGFAFYLGLSTLLDLVASYFFMRPATLMLVKSARLQDRPRLFGMPKPKAELEGEGALA